MTLDDETTLVRLCIAKDEMSWRTLIREYGPAVEQTIRHTLRSYWVNPQTAVIEEIALAVYESLLSDNCRSLHSWRGDSPFSEWLAGVARRRTARWLRAQIRAESVTAFGDILSSRRLEPSDPAASAEYEERLANVRSALQRLPKRDRRLLEETYFENRSYRETADRLGVSVNTISGWIARAKSRLAAILDDLRLLLL